LAEAFPSMKSERRRREDVDQAVGDVKEAVADAEPNSRSKKSPECVLALPDLVASAADLVYKID
jgi:hypothetical protein